jgi:bifunctional DNA-binding transcriptional regulator/antitoxin component of YhaV-PrlF toxin-antitoxin module
MARLTVTSRGQVTLRKEYLKHFGVKPGDKIDLTLLPNGRGEIGAVKPEGSWDDFIGCLAGKSHVRLTIEEMNEAIGAAAAEAGIAGLKR